MTIGRRTFLTGLSGAAVLVLAACTTDPPAPGTSPTPTPSPAPEATPTVDPTAAAGLPSPADVQRSSWGTDPYALGATTLLAAGGSETARAVLRVPLDGKVFLAGEGVAAQQPGTLAGARASGFDVADAVREAAEPGERIAVIGAGLAGATAARSLAVRGFVVVVVEARDRVGGRVESVEPSGWELPVELGGSLLTGWGSKALEVVLGLAGVETVPLPVQVEACDGSGSPVADDDGARQAWLVDALVPARTGVAVDAAAEAPSGLAELLPDDARLVTGGLQAFVAGLLDGLDVLRTANVVALQHGGRGVGLRLATGESLSVDRAVLTVPVAVLQEGTFELDPPLPDAHADALGELVVGQQEVLWLRFEEAFWTTTATVWAVLDDQAVARVWLNLLPVTGQPVLVALVGGDAALALAGLDDDDAVASALEGLRPYLDLVAEPSPGATEPGAPAGGDDDGTDDEGTDGGSPSPMP